MICKPCARGADAISTGFGAREMLVARYQHDLCEGATRCDCQHKVDLQAEGKAVQR